MTKNCSEYAVYRVRRNIGYILLEQCSPSSTFPEWSVDESRACCDGTGDCLHKIFRASALVNAPVALLNYIVFPRKASSSDQSDNGGGRIALHGSRGRSSSYRLRACRKPLCSASPKFQPQWTTPGLSPSLSEFWHHHKEPGWVMVKLAIYILVEDRKLSTHFRILLPYAYQEGVARLQGVRILASLTSY